MEAVFEDIFLKKREKIPFTYHKSTIHCVTNQPNWHSAVEFLYFSKGQGSFVCNTNSYSVKQGDIVFINSKRIHHIATSTELEVNCLIINKSFLEDNGFDVSKTFYQEYFSDPKFETLFLEFIEQFNNEKDEFYDRSTKYAIYRLLVYLSRNYKTDLGSNHNNENYTSSKRIAKILQYIEENIGEKITVDDLAQIVHISKYYLIHEFKKHTGHTINEMINIIRCDYAKNLIANTTQDLATIAYKSGFSSYQYFSNTFKKYVGCSPTKYKNNELNGK